MKEKWFDYASRGNLQEMQKIYEEISTRGLQRELESWKDSSYYEHTALVLATEHGHLDVCQWLVRKDLVNVHKKSKGYGNALHFAAKYNRPEIARFLLEETDIDINEQTDGGNTALHFAACDNNIEVTRILLEYKPLILRDADGDTALDNARINRHDQVIELIRSHNLEFRY